MHAEGRGGGGDSADKGSCIMHRYKVWLGNVQVGSRKAGGPALRCGCPTRPVTP